MQGSNIKFTEAIIDNGKFGKSKVRFETGRLAQQADGCVLAILNDDTTVMSTTTASSAPREMQDFFPLTVDVEERMYAAGKIPGSFFRREGKPPTAAILTARLIDRPLRPLFSKDIRNEIQIIETVLTINPNESYDVLGINGASASTLISGLPFNGPVGGTRLSLVDNQWVAFPKVEEQENSVFEIVVAGRIVQDDVAIAMIEAGAGKNAVKLIEAGADAPDEAKVAEGLEAAKPFIKALCEAQIELRKLCEADIKSKELPLFPAYTDDVLQEVSDFASKKLYDHLSIKDKQSRTIALSELFDQMIEKLVSQKTFVDDDEALKYKEQVKSAYSSVQKKIVRNRILDEEFRIDGRGIKEIRQLTAEVGILPRVHGSALFQRGETQVMGITTLNDLKMEQKLDNLGADATRRYMHDYNFPPYSVGETGRVGSPKRREVGHGALAERALVPVLPSREDFPYAIRQVSEAIGSNGSTSMGSVCASTLALLQAGVPLKASVAGIAMGLISNADRTKYVTLTDILGDEDAFGDMDFKVAGTKDYITALQLDTKLDGIPSDVLAAALIQAKEARLTILEVLNNAISEPNELGEFTPKIESIKIDPEKIGEVIGPKGKVIQEIQAETETEINIEDDGNIHVSGINAAGIKRALERIDEIANPYIPQIGDVFEGIVVSTTAFGAFVKLTNQKDGLLHISQLKDLVDGQRVNATEDVLEVGDEIKVIVDDIDKGKISLKIPDQNEYPQEGSAKFKNGYAPSESSESNNRSNRPPRQRRRQF